MQNTKFIEGQDYEFPSSLIEVLSIQKYSEEADAEVYGFSSSHIEVLSIPVFIYFKEEFKMSFRLLLSKFYQFGNHCNHWLSRIPVSVFSYRSFINSQNLGNNEVQLCCVSVFSHRSFINSGI